MSALCPRQQYCCPTTLRARVRVANVLAVFAHIVMLASACLCECVEAPTRLVCAAVITRWPLVLRPRWSSSVKCRRWTNESKEATAVPT